LPQHRENTKAVHLWLVLWKAYRSLLAAATSQMQKLCLGDSDFRVLEVLLHKGPLPVNTIGPRVDLTPGSISVAVDRLEKRGLVSREMCPSDRRIHTVRLTKEGDTIIRKAFAHHEREMEHLLAGLSHEERSALLKLLKKLGKSVDARLKAGAETARK
jgi:MarR family transcriptional regulator, 2-MHQ and catechol-resistance regulon repressor